MNNNLIKQLKRCKDIQPDNTWQNNNRRVLLSEIDQQLDTRFSFSDFRVVISDFFKLMAFENALRYTKPALILFVAFTVVFGSSIATVSAARSSIPGDTLYPVKLVAERAKITLTLEPAKRAKLHLEIAERRVVELNKLMDAPETDGEKNKKIKEVVEGVKIEVTTAKEKLEKSKQEKSVGVAVAARVIDAKTKALEEALIETKEKIEDVKELNEEVGEGLDEAIEAVDETNTGSLETLASLQEEGETEDVSDVEVKARVKEKVDNAKKQIEKSKEKIGQLEEKLDQIENKLDEQADDSSATQDQGPDSSIEIGTVVNGDQVVSTEEVTAETIKEESDHAEEILEDAERALEGANGIQEALDKIAESKEITKRVDKKVNVITKVLDEVPVQGSNDELLEDNNSSEQPNSENEDESDSSDQTQESSDSEDNSDVTTESESNQEPNDNPDSPSSVDESNQGGEDTPKNSSENDDSQTE